MSDTNPLKEIRRAVADALATAGCGCCRNYEEYDEAVDRLGVLLDIPRFEDDSGVDFYQFRTKK